MLLRLGLEMPNLNQANYSLSILALEKSFKQENTICYPQWMYVLQSAYAEYVIKTFQGVGIICKNVPYN